jgi:Tol biopolymer transport system component
VFIRDLQLGTIVRVSTGSAGEEANADSEHPSISADGHYVAFASAARNLVSSDANSAWDIFLKDVTNGTLVRVSVSSSGAEANGHSFNPVLSGDGQVIAFESEASNLVASDTNSRADVFIHDRGSNTTSRISYGLGTAQANAASTDPSISADGRFIAFVSSASNIVSDDTNGVADVFINDRLGGLTTRASIGNLNAQGQGPALWPALSGDGRYVAFPSGATQFCSGDTNNKVDMFVRGPLF